MKKSKRFLLMVVAALLMVTNAWASQVNVVKKLNGVVVSDNSAGTVAPTVEVQEGFCRLIVTPATGNYVTVNQITVERIVDAGIAQARRRATPDFDNQITVTAENPDADPCGSTSYTFTMPESTEYDVEVTVDFQSRTAITNATITLAQTTFNYNGEACKPAVTSVVLGSTTLTTADYAVSYEDNTAAGTATVKVTGQRTYMGEATTTFTINKATLNLTVTLEGWAYSAQPNTPSVTGNLGEGEVTYTYKAKQAETFSTDVPTNAGDYVVKASVEETDNYTSGEATAEFTISKAVLANASISLTSWTYGDAANTPSVTGNLGEGDVTYSYANAEAPSLNYTSDKPTNAGNYSIKAVIAETDNYEGKEVTNTFSIAKADLSLVSIEDIADQDYTGEAIEPAVVVKFKGNVLSADEYTVSYEDNIEPGIATVKLSSKGVNFSEPDIQPSQTFNILGTVISMNGHTWITYMAASNLTIPSGLKAYVVASINERSVKVDETSYIPQNVAILIEEVEPQDQYVAAPYRSATTEMESLLVGCTTATDVTSLTASNNIYVLYNNEFVKTTSGTISAQRAYLPVSKEQVAGSRLAIGFDNETTGVADVRGKMSDVRSDYFDLQGRKVAQPTKGLYIINGKKVVVK